MDITHPSTAGFASDTRRSDLRGTDAINRRHGGKVYLPFILLVLPLLPRQPAAVAEPDGRSAEFRSLAAAVAGLRHGGDALHGELQSPEHARTVDQAKYRVDGRYAAALLVAQPARPVRAEGFEILLFSADHALLHPTSLRLQSVQMGQEDRPQGVRTGQTHVHRSDGGHHDTGGDLLFQPAAQQDQAHDRRQELQQHQIPLRHRRTTARTGQRHQGRAAATPTADAQRQPVDQ